ncbi:BPSL0761 family protein [Pseudomonas umsongensis]|nr:BPSL0761 family protein [Pseudomonas umsongensis]
MVDLAQDATLSAPIRRQAHQLLRHYPSSNEILRAGQLDPKGLTD